MRNPVRVSFLVLAATLAVPVGTGAQPVAPVPVIGGPCEGCEAVFVGMPDSLSWSSRIAPVDEPGEPMRITGTVVDGEGRPVPGIIVYAYHTNDAGIYPRDESLRGTEAYRHGGLRGFARTDERGRYRFDTIRPGHYPGRDTEEHVHMHVIEPGCCTYWIVSVVFDDDPVLTDEVRDDRETGRGGNGVSHPVRDEDGVWIVRRDIVLGRGVPGYGEFVAEHPRETG